MISGDSLQRLAQLCGIQTEYSDIWGRRHQVSLDTQKALLAAMGIRLESDADVLAALTSREDFSWLNPLPPVQVIQQSSSAPQIRLSLPALPGQSVLHWRLREEQGREHSGDTNFADLTPLEHREIDGRTYTRLLLTLDINPGLGYHRFELAGEGIDRAPSPSSWLIVTPASCYIPGALTGEGRVWGPAVQLYALRSQRNWGIGDFTDLKSLVEWCAETGAGIVGLNPVHALFPHNPAHLSPYSPSSRLFLNILYLDVEAIPEFAECSEAQHSTHIADFRQFIEELRSSKFVEYGSVSAVKVRVLEMLYRHFRLHCLETDSERGRAFRAFQEASGDALYKNALFQTLQEHFHHEDPRIWGWPAWPEAYQDPLSDAVSDFAASHVERIEFFQYLEWEADRQFGIAARRCLELGLRVGLYEDLALSVDRGGAEAWANQHLYATGVSIGSPPDDSNLFGQNWGLPPFVPERLTDAAYGPFIATLRRSMYHAGALRIDHVMGLMRLFWIPPGSSAADGAYVHYPFEDLLGVLALESQRNRCLVIGEDLGTVPDVVREAMDRYGIFSYRVFYYEKDRQDNQKPPYDYPERALVTVGTHDMPTLAGFWTSRDLAVRSALNLFPFPDLKEKQTAARVRDRAAILAALDREGLAPAGMSLDPFRTMEVTDDLVQAIHIYVARSKSKVMMIQIEDLLGQEDQVNLPGTVDEHPNWRRKLTMDLEDLRNHDRVNRVFEAIRRERNRR
jgi:(1->4)-alpha-D-glucan 1-alpha-D-glucosylmutase